MATITYTESEKRIAAALADLANGLRRIELAGGPLPEELRQGARMAASAVNVLEFEFIELANQQARGKR